MNKSDSERIATVIEQMGFHWTEKEEQADLIGIVACSVRQKAIDKVYSKISKWNKWKNKRSLVTFVTGCILPADRDKFLRLFDLIFQISELTEFPEMIRQYGMVTPFSLNREDHDPVTIPVNTGPDFQTLVFDQHRSVAGQPVLMKKPETRISGFWNVEPHYQSTFEAFIPIQNGCDKFCTYCAVPYTRGREISRPSEEILEELRHLVEKGFKSITLLGQNVNSYGLDKQGKEISFAGLLEKAGEYGKSSGKDFWLYFTSPHPRDMSDDVLQVISRYSCLAKQIHLPVQSGDDEVLKKMNRNHSMADYRRIISSIREYLPEATLFTDIIVGFTGETEEQFMNTMAVMEEIRFNMAYIARYSPRPGSASSRWEDDIPHAVKKDRLHRLSTQLQQHSLQHNQAMVGKTFKVLVTGTDRKTGYISGLTEGKVIVRITSGNTKLIGEFVDVSINSAADFATEGELVNVYSSSWAEA
ncbi:MAG: MiaB/RimO family radical SAM methylthiotransferase [Bacteroidales bacterium]|nr:MiaB/RimO family radical SAM methylthiotransferase [Bacteroidales bacterium]